MLTKKSARPATAHMQLGNYRMVALLKKGGFASIYSGEHVHLATKVAIKVLHSWIADEYYVQQFLREARIHASLIHPSIVRLLDFGLEGEIPYMVMDFAPQGTLFEYFTQPLPLTSPTILPFVLEIANALAYVHDQGLVHCDVKPQNILLGSAYQVWLSDFGVAAAAQPWGPCRFRHTYGTALFAAPELIAGEPRMASDQYALAVMIYTWLCGRSPFLGNSTQLCQQHLHAVPPPPSLYIPDLTPEIERVLLRGLAKDPYQRFPTITEFSLAFQHAVTNAERNTDALPKIYQSFKSLPNSLVSVLR